MKVQVAFPASPSVIDLMVSVDIKYVTQNLNFREQSSGAV